MPMVWLAIGIALAGIPLIALLGRARPRLAPWIGAGAAALLAVVIAIAWVIGDDLALRVTWLAGFDGAVSFALDDLGAPLAVLSPALCALAIAYAARYMPEHLRAHHRPQAELTRFCALLYGFCVGMLALALSQDLLGLFVALELTAFSSFLLIAFDWHEAKARRAAVLALVLTSGSSLAFLVGAILLAQRTGTYSIAGIRAWIEAGNTAPVATACLALGVLAKSAQVPLHVWLPRAMIAPTPVSAYLHSAALVASGAFVLQRLWFAIAPIPWLADLLYAIGIASILVGSALALVGDHLKQVLAYSTIAHYGYAIALLASAGEAGTAGAPLYLFAHGLCKCALFLTAGVATQVAGVDRLSQGGGLARRMPGVAIASAIAIAGLAGLPLTIGYFKDELWLEAARQGGVARAVMAVAAVALTTAYAARWWAGLFLGPSRTTTAAPDPRLTLPVMVIAASIVVLGLWSAPARAIARGAGAVITGQPSAVHVEYAWTPALAMAAGAWVAGALLFATRRAWEPALSALARRLARVGPERAIDAVHDAALGISTALYRLEVNDLRDRVTGVLAPTAALILLGWVAAGSFGPRLDPIRLEDLPLVLALVVSAAAGIAVVRVRGHLAMLLSLSFVGYGLALVYALSGAPDVAIVSLIIETLLTLAVLGLFRQLRPEILRASDPEGTLRPRRRAHWVAVAAGAAAAAVTWTVMSLSATSTTALLHVRMAEHAHAGDVVTAILTDFRGLDTAVEITVLATAIAGAIAIERARPS